MDERDKKVISAWHDIPLYVMDDDSNMPMGHLNFICEIPRCSRKKFEIATKEAGNPIKQDEKKGVLREVSLSYFSGNIYCELSVPKVLTAF